MARDTGIADRLREAGLTVVEIAGWQTRGSTTFDPRGSVDHHTAGSRNGNAPSLGVCINGRSDVPGPLCHVLIGRDNTCYVIAAGRANHAGLGGFRGLTGNSSVYGIERENVGTVAEPWRLDQTVTAAKAHAALIRGRAGADMVCRHQEWAPTRKIDTHSIRGDDLRAMVAEELEGEEMAEQRVMIKPPEDHPLAGSWWVADGMFKSWVPDGDTYSLMVFLGVRADPNGQPFGTTHAGFDMLFPLNINPGDPRHVAHAAQARFSNVAVGQQISNHNIVALKGAVGEAEARTAQRILDSDTRVATAVQQSEGRVSQRLVDEVKKALDAIAAIPAGEGGDPDPNPDPIAVLDKLIAVIEAAKAQV